MSMVVELVGHSLGDTKNGSKMDQYFNMFSDNLNKKLVGTLFDKNSISNKKYPAFKGILQSEVSIGFQNSYNTSLLQAATSALNSIYSTVPLGSLLKNVLKLTSNQYSFGNTGILSRKIYSGVSANAMTFNVKWYTPSGVDNAILNMKSLIILCLPEVLRLNEKIGDTIGNVLEELRQFVLMDGWADATLFGGNTNGADSKKVASNGDHLSDEVGTDLLPEWARADYKSTTFPSVGNILNGFSNSALFGGLLRSGMDIVGMIVSALTESMSINPPLVDVYVKVHKSGSNYNTLLAVPNCVITGITFKYSRETWNGYPLIMSADVTVMPIQSPGSAEGLKMIFNNEEKKV